ncbi:MAG: enolase C-terminal domain-like protein [Candidatus Limnocylindrales bacterium]
MKITGVKCILTAPAGVGLAVVKVTTSEPGLYGLGCATFTQRLGAVRTVVEDDLEPLLLGRDPHRIEDIWQLVYQNAYWRNGPVLNNALSGVDQALWDIKGKLAGLPLYELLGGKARDAAAAYAHADGREPEEVLDRVLELREAGFEHVRCQLGGYGGVRFDRARYGRAVPELFDFLRSRLEPEVELLHDVHERLAPIDAVRLAKELEPFRLFYLEDPLAPEDQAWLAALRAQSATPIAMGELFTHPTEWRDPIVARHIDFIRVHVSAIGGITPARKLAALAEAFAVRTAFHGPSDVSPVGHAANVHLDISLSNFGIQEFAGIPDILREVFPGGPELRDGALHPGEGPGLGIELDERLAERYPLTDDMAQFEGGVVDWTQSRSSDGSLIRP